MHHDKLRKFLDGNVDDQEFSQCESILESMSPESLETVVDEHEHPTQDSLLNSLRAGSQLDDIESEEANQITARIEGLIARQVIGKEELNRILDPAKTPDELGRIGKYRVMEFMAAGGMGLVFRAEDTELARPVCIKVMHPALAMKADARVRFERESKAAAKLRSERIVTLFDLGVQRDLPFIVMQLLEGESLRTKLSRMGKLTSQQATQYLKQMGEGLRHAHAHGIIHRDIKPDNIWITPEDDVKLLDFGLARTLDESANLTTSGGLLGTPNYMSPEQIQGKSIDARSDLFSLGIVLYEMLTGQLPFHKNNLFSTMISIANDSVELPSISDGAPISSHLQSLVKDLLHKDAECRLQSADELVARLQGNQATSIDSSEPNHSSGTQPDFSRGNWGGGKLIAAMLFGAAAVLLGMFLVDQNDKGTLVVRTNDPSVEIQIAKEKVSIKDPLTGRKYEIRIGEMPLHGGVYQLEMTNDAGDLRFSSSTIAIRRGETTIVDVELKPNETLENKSLDRKFADSAVTPDKPTSPIVDMSFDLKASEDFSEVLPKLPSLAQDELLQSSFVSLSSSASATKQTKLPGVDRWGITPLLLCDRIENCDGSYFARISGRSLCIFDRMDQLKHVLPTAGQIGFIQFDSRYPNLVAHRVTSIQNDGASWIYVWRIDSDKANLLYRFPVTGYGFCWDGGYRIAYQRNDHLEFFRLDLGKSFDAPGPGKEFLTSVSPDGRFIASQSSDAGQSAINIWDLHRGAFAFSVLNGVKATWSEDNHRIAVRIHRTNDHEIWDLDKATKTQTISIHSDTDPRFLRDDLIADTAFEKSFKRLAWLTNKGELVVRNTETHRQNMLRLPMPKPQSLREMRNNEAISGSLKWKSDGSLRIESSLGTYRWNQTESEVHGKLESVSTAGSDSSQSKIPLQFSSVYGNNAGTPTLEWIDNKTKAINLLEQVGRSQLNSERKPDTWLKRFQLTSMGLPEPSQAYAVISNGPKSGTLPRDHSRGGVLSVSPDGAFCVDARVPNASGLPFGALPNTEEWFITSLADPRQSTLLGLPQSPQRLQVVWQANSKHLMTLETRSKQKGYSPEFRLFDTQNFEWIPLPYTKLPKGDMLQIVAYEEHFLLVTKSIKDSALQIWKFDPDTLQAEEKKSTNELLASLKVSGVNGGSIQAIGKSLFFLFTKETDDPISIDAIPLQSYLCLPDERSEEMEKLLFGITVRSPNQLLFSHDGQFLLQDEPIVTGVTTTAQGRSYALQTGSKFITNWADDNELFSPSRKPKLSSFEKKVLLPEAANANHIIWHPKSNVAFWNNFGNLYFYDADKNQKVVHSIYPSNPPNSSSVLATDYGWMVCSGWSQLFFFDRTGTYLGQLVFDPELNDGLPSNPRWILADGSTCSHCSQKGLYMSMLRGVDFFTMPLEEFSQQFPDTSLPMLDEVPFLKSNRASVVRLTRS